IDYILTMQADDLLFKSYLPKRAFDADFVSELDPGTRLHLTGIFSAQVNSSMSSVSFSSFRLLLNDQHDVSVLARPSWWTTGRLVMGLGGFFGLTLLAFGWVTMLRRRVRLQTEIIEEKLQREAELKEIAETSSRAKTEFLADMSHEIRTPMNGIIGMAAILERTQLSSEQRQHLGIITSSASSLLTILNDVLDLSKVEAGKLQLEEIEFDLEKLVSNAARSLAPAAHGKDLELVCRIAPNVPRLLTGDQNRLRQVLVNLVGNAIKFTESGEVLIDVEAETSLPNVELHVKVVDTGLGIPREKQELIFNAFEQADLSTTRRFGGTGLGLVISRRLVEVMGGRMWLDSEPGRGSTFHFTARLTGRTRAVEVLPDLSVLIVVDHSTTRDVLEEIIRSWRMDPISVSGGHAAARAIEASP
ncbi:MAG: ATP-binding protein, partial [Rhodothermales bacterium]